LVGRKTMTRIKRLVLINCGPPTQYKQGRTAPLLRTVDPFLYQHPSALRAPETQCPSLVIMIIVIRTTVVTLVRTTVVTVVMVTIADANMIRGFSVLTILSNSAKTLVYDC